MKKKIIVKLFLLNLFIFPCLLLSAQGNMRVTNKTSIVSLTVNGSENLHVIVDSKESALYNNRVADKTSITYNNLEMGQHTLLVTRSAQNSNQQERISTIFNLRPSYDMLINVTDNGSLELIETRKSNWTSTHSAMSNTDFNNLLRNVRSQRFANARSSQIENAFSSTNYFTASQIVQLLQLVNAENSRVMLAKQSYAKTIDRNNFSQVYNVLNSQAGKNELDEYVKNFTDDNYSVVAMQDAEFNNLYQGIQRQWPVSKQTNSLTEAFNNGNNNFTSYQVKQLISLVSDEPTRLQLAKLSYRTVTDPANFNQVYTLFTTQSRKDDLMYYVNNYKDGDNDQIAMSDNRFNLLYQSIQQQWPASSQLNSLTETFNNNSYYFSSNQAKQLIQLANTESNRLQLAKLSYRHITDPVNFIRVYDVLNNQSSRDELSLYVNSINGNGSPKTAMSDNEFNNLYQSIQRQYFPNEKMNTLTSTFKVTTNYFTSSQGKQLIQLVSLESNRLELAKLSYRTITDRSNFSLIYDLFQDQSNRYELDSYVKSYRD